VREPLDGRHDLLRLELRAPFAGSPGILSRALLIDAPPGRVRLLPVDLEDEAPAPPGFWRLAYVAPAGLARDDGTHYGLEVRAGLTVSLPRPAEARERVVNARRAAAPRLRPALVGLGAAMVLAVPLGTGLPSSRAAGPDGTVTAAGAPTAARVAPVVSADCPAERVLPDGRACIPPPPAQGAGDGPDAAAGTTTTTTTPAPPQPPPAETTPSEDPAPKPASKPRRQPTTSAPARPRAKRRAKLRHKPHRGRAHRMKARARAKRGTGTATSGSAGALPAGLSALGPIAVPNVAIEQFRIPPFLLPIYQAAGIQYGIPWQVLAAINEIETDYGRNLSVSSAGALGWMQFMPGTWATYGVDANGDHKRDPYNPVDAIFAAARYLKAAGGQRDLRKAIFAYNHAGWYVESVLLRARLVTALPGDLVGALTGLAQGLFPVGARASYTGQVSVARARKGRTAVGPDPGGAGRTQIDIFAARGAPVIAVGDGRIAAIGSDPRRGRWITLEDAYGNRYTYAHLGSVAKRYPALRPQKVSDAQIARELKLPTPDAAPRSAASAGRQRTTASGGSSAVSGGSRTGAPRRRRAAGHSAPHGRRRSARRAPKPAPVLKERLFAHPRRPAALAAGGERQIEASGAPAASGSETFKAYFTRPVRLPAKEVELRPLEPGASVIAGTILGRVGGDASTRPHMTFSMRPAGRGAPLIDPKPILDGWRLLDATAIYRAAGGTFFGRDARTPSVGQVLLMSKEALERRVLSDPGVNIYSCGRSDIAAGLIDRRVLAAIEYLSVSGLRPTITALRCGHSYLTTSGNVSEHSSGNAVDIAAINGTPILGHQGAGSITDVAVRRLLLLQGTMKPHQIITLMRYPGTDNTLSLPDHDDHIHIGFRPTASGKAGQRLRTILKPGQWAKLIARLGQIPNPVVSAGVSKYATPAGKPHGRGE